VRRYWQEGSLVRQTMPTQHGHGAAGIVRPLQLPRRYCHSRACSTNRAAVLETWAARRAQSAAAGATKASSRVRGVAVFCLSVPFRAAPG